MALERGGAPTRETSVLARSPTVLSDSGTRLPASDHHQHRGRRYHPANLLSLHTLAPNSVARSLFLPHPATSGAEGGMIQLTNIEKFYETGPARTWVLRQITAQIQEGEFVTIMGPSGAGKSTLLAILGMLDGSWSGEFCFLDHAVHRMKPKDRVELNKKYIGFVFQQYHLIDDLTVYENLDIPLSYRDVKRAERAAIVADTLDRFGIVAKKDLYPRQLSGGQQQLVAVARAVIASPKLILADEPTGNLHSSQGREIMQLFKKLNDEGTTIIQVTHSEENAKCGHRIINLKDGWIVQ
jgi:ABC-type lipoprotein export system ATPase subunit